MCPKLGYLTAGLVAVSMAKDLQHDWNFDDPGSFTIWAAPGQANVAFDCYSKCMDATNPSVQQRSDPIPLNGTGSFSEAQACEELNSTRAFQRCYVSRCGGISARSHTLPFFIWGWAWGVKYLTNGQTNGSTFELTEWKPFPLGFAAACFNYSGEDNYAAYQELEHIPGTPALADTGFGTRTSATDITLSAQGRLFSDDNRFRVLPRLRRMILPIWTSSELDNYWDYNLYQSSSIIDHPRSLSDLHKHLIGAYITALVAYAHYISISSNKGVSIYRIVQVITYGLIPTFVATQTVHTYIDAINHCLNSVPLELGYLMGHLLGYQVHDRRIAVHASRLPLMDLNLANVESTPKDPRDAKWYLRIVGIAINAAAFFFTAWPYVIRLRYTDHGTTYCATTGFDHRAGWLALTAFIPLIQSLALYLLNKKWEVRPLIAPVLTSDRPWDWRWRYSSDLLSATVFLEFLIHLTGRISVIGLFGRLFQAHVTLILIITFVMSFLLFWFYPTLQRLFSNSDRWASRVVLFSLLMGAIRYAIIVFLLQIFLDMEEYADLALGFVFPWNYKWMVPPPGWLNWW